ncbi:unnamed protein product [Leuciscus chuanchicus]
MAVLLGSGTRMNKVMVTSVKLFLFLTVSWLILHSNPSAVHRSATSEPEQTQKQPIIPSGPRFIGPPGFWKIDDQSLETLAFNTGVVNLVPQVSRTSQAESMQSSPSSL